ncbi:MAG: YggS family pyridoxal phosphate-dependent enzyme [Planctomycetaceae bacterium]|nr:YggS family pyridoxal phosphate-dependent enzyme [Planctomycetaceae bacterium]
MPSKSELKDRYRGVMDRVAAAAERSGRRPEDVLVVAVTKTAGPDEIRQLIDMGHVDLGENRVQQLQQRAAMTDEFLGRRQQMGGSDATEAPAEVRWHMTGHLQRNKVKAVLPLVRLIHSVDSLRLAEELEAQGARAERDVQVLIQVNIAGEAQKHGVALPAVEHLSEQIETMVRLQLRGLMVIGPNTDDPEQNRDVFERAADLFREVRASGVNTDRFNILSMGMSDDFEVAIEEGANVVRVGRAIFGDQTNGDPDDR